MGSGPTIDLAARTKGLAGVVLHSPLLSGQALLLIQHRLHSPSPSSQVDELLETSCIVLSQSAQVGYLYPVAELGSLASVKGKSPVLPLAEIPQEPALRPSPDS